MGHAQSLTQDDILGIAHFSEQDVRRLYTRFKMIDTSGNGQIDPTELMGELGGIVILPIGFGFSVRFFLGISLNFFGGNRNNKL
jgi:hypothetical protein